MKTFKENIIQESDDYFISERHKIGFMILNYNVNFNDELEIAKKHYVNKNLAKEWRNKYIRTHINADIRL